MQTYSTITATTQRILRSAAGSQEFRAFLDLLRATGARPADILALRAENVDRGGKRLTIVPQKLGPTADVVQIPIDCWLAGLLASLPGEGRIFPHLDSKTVPREFLRIRSACLRASKATVHSYRAAKLSRRLKGEQ